MKQETIDRQHYLHFWFMGTHCGFIPSLDLEIQITREEYDLFLEQICAETIIKQQISLNNTFWKMITCAKYPKNNAEVEIFLAARLD